MLNHTLLKNQDQKALEEFHQQLSRLLGRDLIRLALFGSKLTGQDTPESDIDILVLVNDSVLSIKDQILNIAFMVNVKYGVYISPRVISLSTFHDPVWGKTPFLRSLQEHSLTL